MQKVIRLLVLFCLLVTGCAQHYEPLIDENGVVCPLPLPCTYTATIPCTSCTPTKVALTLRRDNLYFLRITTQPGADKEQSSTEMGIWEYLPNDNTILFKTYNNAAILLGVLPANALRVLRVSGGGIPAQVDYDLLPQLDKPVDEDVVRMKGMYTYKDGSAVFSECLSGARFPVDTKEGNAALEQAYRQAPHGLDEPVLVNLEAKIVHRFAMEGFTDEEVLIPVDFLNLQPGILCNGEKSDTLQLVENSWHLIELDGIPLELPKGVQQPFLYMSTKGHKVRGYSGCNRFYGTFLSRGNIFLFNKLYISRMACTGGVEIESRFYRVLSATESYRIDGNFLEFMDESGRIRARLQHGSVRLLMPPEE